MRFPSLLIFVFAAFSLSFAQQAAIQKPLAVPTVNESNKAHEFSPYLFEPYQARYVFEGKLVGIPLRLFSFSTRVTELDKEWQETQNYRLEIMDMLGLGQPDLHEVEISSVIDLKTGLLRKLTARFPGISNERSEADFSEPGKIIISESDGKRSREILFDAQQPIYPCTFSNAFLSYLPLSDSFTGSFGCVEIDREENSNKPVIRFSKRTLRVVGSEIVSIAAGQFDCYKLADETEEIKYNKDGTIKTKKRAGNREFDPESFWKNFYNNIWIDKATRKVVKGQLSFKHGELTVELQPSGGRSL